MQTQTIVNPPQAYNHSGNQSLTAQTPFRKAILALSIKHSAITFFEGEVNQSQALIPPDFKMGHLGFLSNLQEPLPLPKLNYSQVFMINQCGIKYVLEQKVYVGVVY